MTTKPVVNNDIDYVYVVVCRDVPKRHQAVQACHAAIAAAQSLIRCESPYLVLATIADESALIKLGERLTQAGIDHRIFHEADMGGRATALATRTVKNGEREHFRALSLYRMKNIYQRRIRRR